MSRIPTGPARPDPGRPVPDLPVSPSGGVTVTIVVLVLVTVLTVHGIPPYMAIGVLTAAGAAAAELLRRFGVPAARPAR